MSEQDGITQEELNRLLQQEMKDFLAEHRDEIVKRVQKRLREIRADESKAQ